MSGRHKGMAVAAACTAAGVVGGIAGAAAAPATHQSSTTQRHASAQAGDPRGFFGRGGPRMGAGPAVHEDAVVLDKAGTGFVTATIDSGTVGSVSGDQLQVKEAVGKVTYKTVTLTIPAGATVMRDFTTAALTALKAGDRVHVTQSSDGTSVFADSATEPMGGPGAGGPDHFGPGGPGHGGPGGGWPGLGDPGAPGGGGPTTTTTTTATTS